MANLTNIDAIIVELYDNPLTERPDDRYGRVINIASINEDTLIARAIAGGFNGNADSMKATYSAMKTEALKGIVRGEIVNFGLGHVVLDVEGVFEGDSPIWNPEKHKLVATITTTKELRETLKVTPVNVIGLAPGKAAISTITDVVTGKINEVLTPNGMASIRGTRIKIEGEKEGVGLFLTEQDSQTVTQIPVTTIGMNDPSRIMFIIPADLPAGDYVLSIGTQFGGHSKQLLLDVRTVTLNKLLKVE
jgi:hypothetical protein